MRFYLTYKNNGLYDTVVDDTEVIYIPVDPKELAIVNVHKNSHETQEKQDKNDLSQTDKPPILIQHVEEFLPDPDIKDLPLLINIDEIPPEGKYRLPISEEYDPDGNRVNSDKFTWKSEVKYNVKKIIDEANEQKIRLQQAQDAVSEYISESTMKQNQTINDDFLKIDKDNVNIVKEKALEVVTESIDRAISVAKEVNENLQTELQNSEDQMILTTTESSKYFEENLESEYNGKEPVKSIEYAVNVSEKVKNFEKIDTQTTESNIKERKLLIKQEIDEAIESGAVNRTLDMFDRENLDVCNKHYKMEINKDYDSISSERDKSSLRDLDAEQRAFSIGLQTIPHIRENINLSQIDYRLKLLTTFFLQLTNIMVTLTRFISTESNTFLVHDAKKQQRGLEKTDERTKANKINEQTFKSFEQNEGEGLSKYRYGHISDDSGDSGEELIRKGKLSGAKIAQIEGRKTTELTDRMDNVISEFQKKTGFEEKTHDQSFRSRSGSRSKIKSEKNSSYGESQKESYSDHKKIYEEFSESKSQSFDIHEMKSEKHSFASNTSKTETKSYADETTTTDGKNLTYVAIVEAHVYTNKDAIFEEQMRRKRVMETQNIVTENETKQNIRKLSLADAVIIPPTEEISIHDLENKVTKIEKGVSSVEQSVIKIAAKRISEVLEPVLELTSNRLYSVKQAHTVDEPLKTVVQNTDVSTEENEQYFVSKTAISQKIYPSLEQPTKSVVEITEITADANECQDLDKFKLIVSKPKCIIEDAKPIAETLEISIKEDELFGLVESKPHVEQPLQIIETMKKSVAETTEVVTASNTDMLITPEVLVKTSRTAIEDVFKATAEVLTTLPEESKNDFVESTKIKQESATVSISEKVSSEVFEVSVIEQQEQCLDKKVMRIEQPILSLEKSAFGVAEKSSICPIEPSIDVEIVAKTEQTASIKFDELKAVESTIINLEEPGTKSFKTLELIKKYPQISTEEPHLMIAEVLTILPDEPKNINFEVSKITECTSSIDILETKALETIIIHPEEPKYEQFETLRIAEKIPETTFEAPSLKVAEIITMLPEEPKDEFYVLESKNQQAGITIIECNAAEATIVEAEESKQLELKIEKPTEKRSRQTIEPSNLSAAEVFDTTIGESSKIIFMAEKVSNQLAHVKIEEYKAIESTEVSLGDLTYKELKTAVPDTKQIKTSVEESVQHVAQITEVHPSEAENKIAISSKVFTEAEASLAIEAIKTTEIVKSKEAVKTISPTSPLSPTTPVVEEYIFSLEAELDHPYVVEEAVSEEASLRIKKQKMEIQSAGTSYTLAIESIVESNSESIEETEEIENIHISKEVHESTYEEYETKKTKMSTNIGIKSQEENQIIVSDAHNAHLKLAIKNQSTMQDATNISSIETNQNVPTTVHLDSYNFSLQKASMVEGETISSQSILHKSRKMKSNESQNSTELEQESSVKTLQTGSLGARIEAESSQYVEAENKKLFSSTLKSMESEVKESSIELETHHRVASSSFKEANLKSVKSNSLETMQSESQLSTQVIKGKTNSSVIDEKLTLQTDLRDTISKSVQSLSPPSVPPTPLTDEYIFRLQTELPEESTFIPRDCSISPESTHEDVIVNGLLTNYKTKIEERILYNPPVPTPSTPPEKKKTVYTKPGLKGGSDRQELTKEDIDDSTLVSAIDRTLKQIEDYKASVGLTTEEMSYHQEEEDKEINPIHMVEEWLENEGIHDKANNVEIEDEDNIKITVVTEANNAGETTVTVMTDRNVDDSDLEIQEISENFDEIPLEIKHEGQVMFSENKVDDFKSVESVVDDNLVSQEEEYEFVAVHPSTLNGKSADPSIVSNQFESEIFNLNAQGADSVTTDKSQELVMLHDQEIIGEEAIIPPIDSLKNSEVIKLLNEERTAVEERKWTTFLQKRYTPPPKTEVVYYGDFDIKTQVIPDAYKVKIVRQPKPKIAPDWKAEELKKESSPVIEISEPQQEKVTVIEENNITQKDDSVIEQENTKVDQNNSINEQEDKIIEDKIETELVERYIDKESEELELEEMAQRNLAEELIKNVEKNIDINAPTEQQLEQMRDQLAALAQLPSVIQQTVELVNKRINLISQREQQKKDEEDRRREEEESRRQEEEERKRQEVEKREELERTRQTLEMRVTKTEEELAIIKKGEMQRLLEWKIREEKQKKVLMARMKIDQESRQVTQRSKPRVGQPMPLYGPIQERPVILPGGRKWRTPEDVYDEELINESLVGQAEVIKGTAIGVNFRKFEKPPPPLDHLKHSEVFKAIHEVEQPLKKVELLGPVLSEADYIERARSMSPCVEKVAESSRKQLHP